MVDVVNAFLADCAAIATVLGVVVVLATPFARRAWRRREARLAAVEDLLHIHRYPHRPPPGHALWPERPQEVPRELVP